ncbi:hypothetical protein AVEN_101791-1 [Araneus ventricosus]|uniref:Uncharacterized protein n=1 Tax=Araneus ventricosus TaxID=182803 RepID=A0A4Y2CZ27_ARAVE|nr:hypothetical protein AVEN_101791-1 [Araneus ventricosus]
MIRCSRVAGANSKNSPGSRHSSGCHYVRLFVEEDSSTMLCQAYPPTARHHHRWARVPDHQSRAPFFISFFFELKLFVQAQINVRDSSR